MHKRILKELRSIKNGLESARIAIDKMLDVMAEPTSLKKRTRNAVPVRPAVLRSAEKRGEAEPKSTRSKPNHRTNLDRVLTAIEYAGDAGISKADLVKRVHMNRNAVQNALMGLKRRHMIASPKRGYYKSI